MDVQDAPKTLHPRVGGGALQICGEGWQLRTTGGNRGDDTAAESRDEIRFLLHRRLGNVDFHVAHGVDPGRARRGEIVVDWPAALHRGTAIQPWILEAPGKYNVQKG